jgi:hypothetical protein
MEHPMRAALLSLVLLLFAGFAAADEFRIGVATQDITPPVGYRMCGYFSERVSTGTHDPLLAKAIVFQQGDTQAAIVCCDLIGMHEPVTIRARELAKERTGIPAEHILVHGTHSHTGPLYFGSLREHYHGQAIKDGGKDAKETLDYGEFLATKIAAAIEQAVKQAKPAQLAVAKGEERTISFNRRFHLKDGSVKFNPGKFNPNIVRVAGPIDPEVSVLLATDGSGKPFGSLTNFALHLDTVGGTEYSADYPVYLEQTLREKFGQDFISVFGNGTCGDINHIDVAKEQPQKGQEMARHLGTTLGKSVLQALEQAKPVAEPQLAVRRKVVSVPQQQYDADQLAAAKAAIFLVGQRKLPFLEEVQACKIIDCHLRGGGALLPLDVQAFRLSDDVAIVGLPGEVFVELGLWIKQYSPFKTTLVIELSNDCPAYVPTRKAFAEGSYETINSRVQAGGGELMAQAALELLRDLKK